MVFQEGKEQTQEDYASKHQNWLKSVMPDIKSDAKVIHMRYNI